MYANSGFKCCPTAVKNCKKLNLFFSIIIMLRDIELVSEEYRGADKATIFYVSKLYAPGPNTRPRLVKQVMYVTFTRMIKKGKIPARYGDVIVMRGYNIKRYGFIYDGRNLLKYGAYKGSEKFYIWQINPSTGAFIHNNYWLNIFGDSIKIDPSEIDRDTMENLYGQVLIKIQEYKCYIKCDYHKLYNLLTNLTKARYTCLWPGYSLTFKTDVIFGLLMN